MTTRTFLCFLFLALNQFHTVKAEETTFPLHRAAAMGHTQILQELIKGGEDVNRAGIAGYTPLIDAAYAGKADCLRLLLEAGADVNRADSFGCTPLGYAAAQGHDECVKLLLQVAGIDINKTDIDNETPLIKACLHLQEDCVKLLLDAPNLNIAPNFWEKVFFCAISTAPESIRICRMLGQKIPFEQIPMNALEHFIQLAPKTEESGAIALLSPPGINVRRTDTAGKTLLHYAAAAENKFIIRLLLAAGADVNAADKQGNTPLDCCPGKWECHELLKQACAISNQQKNPPVIIRIKAHDATQLRALLEEGADVNCADSCGIPALMLAVYHQQCHPDAQENLRMLLKHPHIDVNRADKEGRTPLHAAADYGRADVLRELLNFPVIQANVSDSRGRTPLHEAAESGSAECVRLLLQNGSIDINQADKDGQTALLIALEQNHADCIHLLLNSPELSINQADKYGETALHLAAEKGLPELMQKILQIPGIEVNSAARTGQTTPLMAAVPHPECVKLLVNDERTDTTRKNFMGDTALHLACQQGNTESLRILLTRPTDKQQLSELLQCSIFNNQVSCVELLLKQGETDTAIISQGIHTAATHGYTEILRMLLRIPGAVFDMQELLYEATQNGHHSCVELLLQTGND